MNAIAERMYGRRTADAHTRVRVGVGVIVRDDLGRVLLERRSDCGLWGCLGGRIEPGETVEEAARREVFEEAGLHVRIERLLGVYSDPAEGRIVAYTETDVFHLVDVVVEAVVVEGQLRVSPESLELQFFEPDKITPDLVPPARQALRDYATHRVGVVA